MATRLKITLVRSTIGAKPKHKLTAEALGLRRMQYSVLQPNNPQIRGMVRQIAHLLKVVAVEADAGADRGGAVPAGTVRGPQHSAPLPAGDTP
jgi:large subunit ribosomal protein L30